MLERGSSERMRQAAARQLGGKISVDFKKGIVSLKSKESLLIYTVFGSGELPEGLPSDIYFDKTNKVKACIINRNSFNLEMENIKGQDIISSEYKDKMQNFGWSLENEGNMSALGELQFSKEGRSVEISFTSLMDNHTQVFVIVRSSQTL